MYDIEQALGSAGEISIMRECVWVKMRTHLSYTSKLSKFIGRKKISKEDILGAIETGEFFGICKVRLSTPKHVIEKFKDLNFPFIFDKKSITEDLLGDKMKNLAKSRGRKFPYQAMTLCYNADHRLVVSPLLKFYLNLGMVVDEIYYCIEYVEAKPFGQFVEKLVDLRVRSVGVNKPQGDRAKFSLNSAIGRFGLNLEKHRQTKYTKSENLYRHTHSPLLQSEHELVGEYPLGIHEICKKRRQAVDKIPVHISLFIYQRSKAELYTKQKVGGGCISGFSGGCKLI